MMNPEAREEFDRITAIMPDQLTKDEVAFLKARRDYLRPEQVEAFKSILSGVKPMSKEDRELFEKENKKALIEEKKKADKLAEETKTVTESQNPENN